MRISPKKIEVNEESSPLNVTDQFLAIYEKVNIFQKSKSLHDYIALFAAYLQLAGLLGITNDEILQAYFAKNEVNYQRQQNNY